MMYFPTNHIFIAGNISPEKADTLGVMNFSSALYLRLKFVRDMKTDKHWHSDRVSMKELKAKLREANNTGDMVEVGCIAMMIHNRKNNRK